MNARKKTTTRSLHLTGFIAIPAIAIAIWLTATSTNAEQRKIEEGESNITPTPTSALLTGDTASLHNAIATSGATAEIRLTPAANYPGGAYAHGGYYSDANINGQRLSVTPGGGRTFWIAQLSNWGPSGRLLRAWQGRVNADGLLGANADCGGGPGSCAAAADLIRPTPACVGDADCVAEFGEEGGFCNQGLCEPALVNTNRQDFVYASLAPTGMTAACARNDPAGPICFGLAFSTADSAVDQPGVQFYGATFIFDVPSDAEGVYTIGWTTPDDTFFLDETSQGALIPLAAMVPGELNVLPDLCPGINPLTHCCDPLTGATTVIPPAGPCTLVTCDGATPVLSPQPVGTPCTSDNVCLIDPTCSSDGLCVGTPSAAPTLALVTADRTKLHDAIEAGGPTAEIRLTPVATNPGGAYAHSGYYSDTDITGQRLKVANGGGRTFWIAQVSNWGPSGQKFLGWQARIDSDSFLGANADCGGGPGSCAAAGDLTTPRPACAADADCVTEFGEAGALCKQLQCDSAFINTNRQDFVFSSLPSTTVITGCGVIDPAGPICFGITILTEDAIVDQPGVQFYAGTYVVDVPTDAAGAYALEWTSPDDTFFIDDTNQGMLIPLAAMVPGTLEVTVGACCVLDAQPRCLENVSAQQCADFATASDKVFHAARSCPGTGLPTDLVDCLACIDDSGCDDLDVCTVDRCNLATFQCENGPLPGWNPETSCCNSATGEIANFPLRNECVSSSCSALGELILTPVATCSPCQIDNLCTTEGTCSDQGVCIASPSLSSECTKSRYISFTPIDVADPFSYIEVKLVSLHRPTPPYPPSIETKDFSSFEGEVRWVGAPFDCPDSPSAGTILKCAFLTCTPTVVDWTALTGGLRIHITGDAIVPSSVYDIEQWSGGVVLPQDPPLKADSGVRTSRWGDVGVPFQNTSSSSRTQPNVTDIVFVIDKVKDAPGALAKPRIQMRGNTPDPTLPANSTDLVLTVDAVKGSGFPYSGPTPCNP